MFYLITNIANKNIRQWKMAWFQTKYIKDKKCYFMLIRSYLPLGYIYIYIYISLTRYHFKIVMKGHAGASVQISFLIFSGFKPVLWFTITEWRQIPTLALSQLQIPPFWRTGRPLLHEKTDRFQNEASEFTPEVRHVVFKSK